MSHPSACLLSWLIATVALQFLGWPALAVAVLALLVAGSGVRRRWWILARRARWLLLTLWLILAYGTPGDAWLDQPWAPSQAGLVEASLHAVRLVVMLGALAWLFHILPRDRLMAGIWVLSKPLRHFRIDADRLVVRLALVFDYLEKAPPKGTWRHLLDESRYGDGLDSVRIELPRWRPRDTGMVLATALILALGAYWS